MPSSLRLSLFTTSFHLPTSHAFSIWSRQLSISSACIYATSYPLDCLQILGKAEFLNPGGSVKDRVALRIVHEALASGQLSPGGLITEGTAGSTGVSLAVVRCGKHITEIGHHGTSLSCVQPFIQAVYLRPAMCHWAR
eukprot:GHUV01049570.1.p1 GENE.GHUV01049570.1~~GHUV01049570.1.p1  ORF type:complete len:138 (-),score=12.84 GHUV01049570.1:77-490(-)